MRHLIAIRDLEREEIEEILEKAAYYKQRGAEMDSLLRGRFVAELFLEPSTRTRFSFEVAAKRLGAEVLHFDGQVSSLTKGESYEDTLRTLEALGVEIAIIRTAENDFFRNVEGKTNLALVNAGAGTWEHPTQALLDLFTLREHFGSLRGLTVGMIGDLAFSRVVGSHMHLLPKFGIHLLLAGAPGMTERKEDPYPPTVKLCGIEEVIREADVVILLRIQRERHREEASFSKEEYLQKYGLTVHRAQGMKPHAMIMHPAPVNRDVELESSLVDSPRSLIFRQVENGVYTRMAVLQTVWEGKKNVQLAHS
ncbi:aspartate carbamoyltransferase catalytic subunit [Thermicanus aegyptius]|uniref:aspartate carbamoyltransferase catalytic subunit n=1 Tax=Thermicanus aegyptius TaxID=94009 RepID=UPI0004137240|nr:aspartate carbamoyltransferase catalytic subunit [Thermicanus aegyptius]